MPSSYPAVPADEIVIDDSPNYGRAPRSLLRDPDVSPQAKAMWTLLEDYASPGSPMPFPGQDTLAEHMGVTSRSVRSWLHELRDHGWLEIESKPTPRGTRNSYRLRWKQASDGATRRKQASADRRKNSSGARRKHTSAEEEPVDVEPVEEVTPRVAPSCELQLFAQPSPEPAVQRGSGNGIADLIVKNWWEKQHPRPQQPYVSVLKIARKAIADGWDERDLAQALDEMLTVSGSSLDLWRNRRDKKTSNQPAWSADTRPPDQYHEDRMNDLARMLGRNTP